jgi:error-prone DNA polymerase
MGYVELAAFSNYSFLDGGSHPQELALTAAALGHPAIAITDRNSLAGIVRAYQGCNEAKIRHVVGARLEFIDGTTLLIYPTDRAAYGRLCELLTVGRRAAPKGECYLTYADLLAHKDGQIGIALPPEDERNEKFAGFLSRLKADFPRAGYLALSHLYRGDDAKRLHRLQALADRIGLPTVAVNDVRYHVPERRVLMDVLTCVKERCAIDTAGYRLMQNAERHLKPEAEMRRLFRGYEAAVDRTVEIAGRCRFSLSELKYEYPEEVVGPNETPQQSLARLAWEGADWRYPEGVPEKIKKQISHELKLIEQLNYAPYFLTVNDIVRFAREKDILHQGRGSAANSTVCYCLGVTAVNPIKTGLLFERFISDARQEPPDIDIDFEHERREEVMQYIYDKYGRNRTGLAATVICYRSRAALRDVGKVMGLSVDVLEALTKTVWGWSSRGLSESQVREAGFDPSDRRLMTTLELTQELIGFPRHLSQHVGGFVISRGPLSSLVPIENAAMQDRTVIQWDKDDLETLGMIKVDVLALGMLTCIRKAFDLLRTQYDRDFNLATLPQDDPKVYEMLCQADSVGVFQVESRAQMSMLPRLRPRNYYDLVIEVAIVRPGPIQGDMVHPYLRRRDGKEAVYYPKAELEAVLERTLGVPLFQEQAMQIAMVAAAFTASEADGLRRAMATFKKTGDIPKYRDKLIEGMVARGYERDFAERCYSQIEGFGNYGFPESHAASFALLVYVSAWIKYHYPAVFLAAILNSQPMGFYQPAQLIRDAVDHGVELRPVDVNFSLWENTLEQADDPRGRGGRYAVRLGFRQVKGLAEADMARLVAARDVGYESCHDLWRRGGMTPAMLTRLAEADAFRSLGLDRRQALWEVKALDETKAGSAPALPLFGDLVPREIRVDLPEMPLAQHVVEDYQALSLSLKRHPVAFLRERLTRHGVLACNRLPDLKNGQRVFVAGLVLVRQRPGSASGVIFVTLEDESGIANLVVWPKIFEAHRRIVMSASLLGCHGRVQIEGKLPHQVIHIVAEKLLDLTAMLSSLREDAPPLKPPFARADEVVRGIDRDPREAAVLDIKSRDFH